MKTSITVIQAEGPLARKVWTFYNLTGLEFVLDTYREESRPSPRHAFKTGAYWSRLNRHSNTVERPTVPESVEAEALATITSLVSVKCIQNKSPLR